MRLTQHVDSTGRPICVRCLCRVFNDEIWCASCEEMVRREVESISFQQLTVVPLENNE